jgi:hypothetical protein
MRNPTSAMTTSTPITPPLAVFPPDGSDRDAGRRDSEGRADGIAARSDCAVPLACKLAAKGTEPPEAAASGPSGPASVSIVKSDSGGAAGTVSELPQCLHLIVVPAHRFAIVYDRPH